MSCSLCGSSSPPVVLAPVMVEQLEWTLQLPNGKEENFTGDAPKSIREVVLLGALHSDEAKLKGRHDVDSLLQRFHLLGHTGQSHVNLLSDANLRRYCTAAQPCCLSLGIGAAQSGTSLEDYVVARERAKAEETVVLNVGGKIREIHRITAERIPLLAAMLRFPRDGKDSKTPIFVDASAKVFDVLLEVARGRKREYVETLEPSLKLMVEDYAEYAGMSNLSVAGFQFKLSATNPTNPSVTNIYAYISDGDSTYTTGIRAQWNTVFGTVQVPGSGQTYWEVEVTSLGTVSPDFLVGVTTTANGNANTVLDASNQGYGLSYTNATVSIRSNQNAHTNVTQSFPISNGTRLGVLVDTHRGSLMFFHNGTFKCSHHSSIKGLCLLPALSSSVCESLHTTAVQYAMMQRSFWDAELRQVLRARAAAGTCHDDSRLEFLLRNRDRMSEWDWDHWDHLSQAGGGSRDQKRAQSAKTAQSAQTTEGTKGTHREIFQKSPQDPSGQAIYTTSWRWSSAESA
eukprot:symbB.v1.2.004034.t1/scaffold228.1/size260974/3